jgi:hypothetical protein
MYAIQEVDIQRGAVYYTTVRRSLGWYVIFDSYAVQDPTLEKAERSYQGSYFMGHCSSSWILATLLERLQGGWILNSSNVEHCSIV